MATSKEFKNKVTPPNWGNIDGENNQEISVSTEELNKKVEEYEKKDLKQVSIKDTENLPIWKSVLYDEDGNEYIGPKGFKVEYIDNEVRFVGPFLRKSDKGFSYIHRGFLSEYLIKNVPVINSTGKLYFFDNGVYRPANENEDKGIVKELLTPEYAKSQVINDVVQLWKIDSRINKFPHEINKYPFKLNLLNGTFDLQTWEFTKGHSIDNYSTIQIQANYDPNANGENFNKFINSAVPDKELQMLLQEMVGYCLTPLTDSKKMIFIFDGPGDAGKSTFITATLENLLTDNAKSHIPLQDLSDNEYKQAELFGKVVNIFADLPAKGIKDNGYLKAATGNDRISARRPYGQVFEFYNKAKFVFSTNGLPDNYSKDTSDAFYNRLSIIPFKHVPAKKDPHLKDKLYKEKDAILLWILDGLRRLIHENNFKFTESRESSELVQKYREENNPVMKFMNEHCEFNPDAETARISLFTAWQNFCEQNGHIAGSQTKFNKKIESIYGNLVKRSQMNNSRRTKSWKGIKLLDFDEI